jgi:hypothetical protein
LIKDYCLLIIGEWAAVTIVGVCTMSAHLRLRGWVDEIRFTLHEIRRPAASTLFTSERATTEPRALVIPSLPRDLPANERVPAFYGRMLQLRYAPLSMTIPRGRLVGVRHVYQTHRLIDPATINESPPGRGSENLWIWHRSFANWHLAEPLHPPRPARSEIGVNPCQSGPRIHDGLVIIDKCIFLTLFAQAVYPRSTAFIRGSIPGANQISNRKEQNHIAKSKDPRPPRSDATLLPIYSSTLS